MTEPLQNRIVAVSQRIDDYPDREERRDAVDQKLLDWVIRAGYLPVPVPNVFFAGVDCDPGSQELTLKQWLEMLRPRAVLLSGGNDIGDYPERDATESCLLDWAESRSAPVLGVCRGLQMMAVRTGVNLEQRAGHVKSRHELVVSANPQDWPVNVNSYHNWCLTSCPPGYETAASLEDGTIEAIKHSSLPWEGWMWHPEREREYCEQDTRRLQELFGE